MTNLFGRLFGKQDGDKIENPKLLAAMHAVALADTPENRKTLYTEMLAATFILPTPELPAPPGEHVADEHTTIQLVGIKDQYQRDLVPAFTDDEALRNWDPNTPSIALKARAFFEMLLPLPFQEVIINPYDPIRKMLRPGGRVTRGEFECLAKGELPQLKAGVQTIQQAPGTRVQFGKPKEPFAPEAMKQVAEELAKFPEVHSAFLLMIMYGEEKPHRAIAVRLDQKNAQKISEQRQTFMAKVLLGIIRPLLAEDEPFDLIPLGDQFYQDVVRTIQPFYARAAK